MLKVILVVEFFSVSFSSIPYYPSKYKAVKSNSDTEKFKRALFREFSINTSFHE